MEIRNHGNWGHGLRPGTTSDINCQSCKREDAEKREREERNWAGPGFTQLNDESASDAG